jgi:hypothetical protein
MINYHKPVLDFLCKSIGTEFIRSYSDEAIQANSEFFIEIFKAQISLKKASLFNVTDHNLGRQIQKEITQLQEYCFLLGENKDVFVKENKQTQEERKPITVQMVKELRDKTGLCMMECKKALTSANGDMELALNYLRKPNYTQLRV